MIVLVMVDAAQRTPPELTVPGLVVVASLSTIVQLVMLSMPPDCSATFLATSVLMRVFRLVDLKKAPRRAGTLTLAFGVAYETAGDGI